MKRIIVNKYGGPEVLEIENFNNIEPQGSEIKVKVKNIGVNFADSLIIKGRYQERPRPPFSPGLEFSGKVLELGSAVKNFKIGDRVIGIAKYGTYTQEIIIPAENLYKIPDQMDYETASSFPVAYGTAHGAIFWKGKLKKNQTCLILGAAGGVGLAAVDIASNLGAKVIAAAGSDQKCKICEQYGASHTINYNESKVRHEIKKIAKNGGVLVIDMVGGESADDALKNLSWEGKYVSVGFASGIIPKISANRLLLKSSYAIGLYWGEYAFLYPNLIGNSYNYLFQLYIDKKIKPLVGKTFKLEQAQSAIEHLLSKNNVGKIILSN